MVVVSSVGDPTRLLVSRWRRRLATRCGELGLVGGVPYRLDSARGLRGGFLLLGHDRAVLLRASRFWGDPGEVDREVAPYRLSGPDRASVLVGADGVELVLHVPPAWRGRIGELRRQVGQG